MASCLMFRRVAKSATASETAPLEGSVSVTRFEITMMTMMKIMMTMMTLMIMTILKRMTRMLFMVQIITFTFYPA